MRVNRPLSWGALLACGALLAGPGCLGPQGPQLPENVGSTHAPGGRGGSGGEEAPEVPAEPVPVGTLVWADYHDTGFHFHGVVVERREDRHRVIYDDGASEWLGANALLPDHIAEDAEIDVRSSFTESFGSAQLGRRLGRAMYVRMATGDERWTALPHVRFAAGREGVPRRGDAPDASSPPAEGAVGATVLVNYQSQGLRFPAVVTARAEDGRLHVVYLDGETEWVDPRLTRPDDLGEGAIVHIRRTWEPPEWVRGRVQQRIGDAFRVELDDGGLAWTSLFRVRVAADASASDAVTPSVPDAEPDEDAAAP